MKESLTSFVIRIVCEHPLDEGCHRNAFIHSADQLDQHFERLLQYSTERDVGTGSGRQGKVSLAKG